MATPKVLRWPDGRDRPALGLGTYGYGEDAGRRQADLASLREAIEIGYRAFDTAEMYADGGAETLLGQALAEAGRAGRLSREDVFVVSKVYPHHAGGRKLIDACERSRRRLQLDRIDLYLLHWRGEVPLVETVAGMQELQRRGRIGAWGVSNFDVDDLDELLAVPGGADCASNQVWYSLTQRGVEFDLLPWQQQRGWPLMAYSPIDKGVLPQSPQLAEVAERRRADTAQIAVAALLAQPGVMVIPKASRSVHLRRNWEAQFIALSVDDRARIDRAFPPPGRKTALAMS